MKDICNRYEVLVDRHTPSYLRDLVMKQAFWFAVFDDKYIHYCIPTWTIGSEYTMHNFDKLGAFEANFECIEIDPDEKAIYFQRIKQ